MRVSNEDLLIVALRAIEKERFRELSCRDKRAIKSDFLFNFKAAEEGLAKYPEMKKLSEREIESNFH